MKIIILQNRYIFYF